MDEALKLLISTLKDPLAISAAVFLLASVLYFTRVIITKANAQELATWEQRLRAPKGAALYQEWLTAILDWVREKLMPNDADPHSAERPWGWPLLDLCFRFAVAYPVLMLMLGWALFGLEGRLGSQILLPEDLAWWARAAVVSGFLALIVGRLSAEYLPSQNRLVFKFVAYGLASTFAAVFAIAGPFAIAGVVAGALVSACLFAVLLKGASAVAGAVAIVVAIIVSSSVRDSIAVGIALVIALAIADVVERVTRRGYWVTAYSCFILLVFTILALVAMYGDRWEQHEGTVLVFLGILPILNALFDYASIGLTRYLLRRGLANPRFSWA